MAVELENKEEKLQEVASNQLNQEEVTLEPPELTADEVFEVVKLVDGFYKKEVAKNTNFELSDREHGLLFSAMAYIVKQRVENE